MCARAPSNRSGSDVLRVLVQLLPLMWLGLMTLNFTVVVLLKWALMQRLQPGSFAKYTWAFQTRAISVGIQVCTTSADASIRCLLRPQ